MNMKQIIKIVGRPFFLLSITISVSASAQNMGLSEYERMQYEECIANTLLHQQQNSNKDNNIVTQMPAIDRLVLADADNDGMPDTWESSNSLDQNDPTDAWGDPDNDKVINLFEYQLNSNPNSNTTPSSINVVAGGNIETAINSAADGQVIRIESGTYNLNYKSFSPKTIMIQGGWNHTFNTYDPANNPTIFDGQSIEEVLYFSWNDGVGNVVIDGVSLINGVGSFGALNFYMYGSANGNLCVNDCQITNSESTFSFGGAVNIMHKDSSYSEVFIVSTLIANNYSTGVYNQTVGKSLAKWHIINSTITSNSSVETQEGFGISGFTLTVPSTINIYIKNTIDWGNQKKAINYDVSGGPVYVIASYSNIDTVSSLAGFVYNAGSGVIDLDPEFVNAAGNDYQLSQGSPCINTGINIGLPYISIAPDMGAFESESGAGITQINSDNFTSVYPNPFHTSASLLIQTNVDIDQAELIIFDLAGCIVSRQLLAPATKEIIINRGTLSDGMYYYQLLNNNQAVGFGKIVIQ